MQYRPEIDGLRTVAVVPVVLFHAGIPGFAGGYAGVDVFFVISGFLITTLLLEDMQQERFSILQFYERRARRILPALTFVVAVTTVFALMIFPPDRLAEYGASMVATAVFAANVYFWQTTDYFATAGEERPLLHMWSLAVEEQFYILFPIMLLIIWRLQADKPYRALWASFIIIALGSLAMSIMLTAAKPTASFYLPITRAWELLAGSIVALALNRNAIQGIKHRQWLAGLGAAVVLASLIGIDKSTPWPGLWTLFPVLGTVMVIAFAQPNCPTGRLLSLKPMVFIGLLSYSIYLWHQPLYALVRGLSPNDPTMLTMIALAFATLPLSWLTWRFVEQPFRTPEAKGGMSRGTIFAASAASLSCIVLVGVFPIAAPKTTERVYLAALPEPARAQYQALEKVRAMSGEDIVEAASAQPCRQNFEMVTQDAVDLLLQCTDDGSRALIITGGSHALDVYSALSFVSETDVIISFSRGFCRPHRRLEHLRPRPHDCPFDGVKDLVAAHPDRIGLLVYTQAGFTVLRKYRAARTADDIRLDLVEEVGEFVSALADHVPVVVLGPRPTLGLHPKRLSVHRPFESQIAASQDPGILVALTAVDVALSQAVQSGAADYISHFNAIDTRLPEEALIDAELTYRDLDHWSVHGALIFGERLLTALKSRHYDIEALGSKTHAVE